MSLNKKEIQKIIHSKDEKNPIVSAYVNLTRPDQVPTLLNSMCRDSLKKLNQEANFSPEQQEDIEKLCARIKDAVQGSLSQSHGSRMVVLFANTAGLWEEFYLPVALPSQMQIRPEPYTRPLSILTDEFPRYCIVAADSRKSRVFTMYLGEIEEENHYFIEDDVPDGVRTKASMGSGRGAVMSGLGDQRIERHIQDHVHRHLKNTADHALSLLKDPGFDWTLVASTQEHIVTQVQNHLHSYVLERLVGTFKADPDDKPEEIRTKSLEAAQKWERENESRILSRLIETSNSGGLAVLGLEPVLEALTMGQVHTLLVDHNFQVSGTMCSQDRTMSTYLQTCPVCGQAMQQTDDLVEEMVQEAILQNAEINHVFMAHEEFSKYRIGAFLRFAL